jgi:hypothetical protein
MARLGVVPVGKLYVMPMRLRLTRGFVPFLQLAVASCSGATTGVDSREPITEEHTGYRLEYVAADRVVAQSLVPMIERGRQTAEQFFATTYVSSFVVRVFPDRAALTARWRVAFNQPTLDTQCWMIAGGWATEFDILSPGVWRTEACGHDGSNANHVANVVAHELVHVLHGQRNSALTSLAAATPWIVEGIAAFASGQWASDYAASVRPIVSGGFAPETFATLWSSSANYALAGSVFAYINQRFGVDAVRRLLTVRSEAELLTALATDAPTLLREWRSWALAQ